MGSDATTSDEPISSALNRVLSAVRGFLSRFFVLIDDSGDRERSGNAIIGAFAFAVVAVLVYFGVWRAIEESGAYLPNMDEQGTVWDRAIANWQCWAPEVHHFLLMILAIPIFMLFVLYTFQGRARLLAGSLSSISGFVLTWAIVMVFAFTPPLFLVCELFGWHGPTPVAIITFAVCALFAIPQILCSGIRPITKAFAVPVVLFALLALANGPFL